MTIEEQRQRRRILIGDNRTILPDLQREGVKVDTIVTSPPYYGLRTYMDKDEIGREETPDSYIESLVGVFGLCRDVLADAGTLWVVINDSYAGSGGGYNNGTISGTKQKNPPQRNKPTHANVSNMGTGVKPKDLIGIPFMLAFAMRQDGWYWRNVVIWHKPNPIPEPQIDRLTVSHEYVLLFSKSREYYFDYEAIQERSVDEELYSGRRQRYGSGVSGSGSSMINSKHKRAGTVYPFRRKRSVWTVNVSSESNTSMAHPAKYPDKLIYPCILAGSREGGTVLDPFAGSGTTGRAADKMGRDSILIEINPEYEPCLKNKTKNVGLF